MINNKRFGGPKINIAIKSHTIDQININLDFFLIDIQYIFKTQTISNPLFENLYSDITSSL